LNASKSKQRESRREYVDNRERERKAQARAEQQQRIEEKKLRNPKAKREALKQRIEQQQIQQQKMAIMPKEQVGAFFFVVVSLLKFFSFSFSFLSFRCLNNCKHGENRQTMITPMIPAISAIPMNHSMRWMTAIKSSKSRHNKRTSSNNNKKA
jgi:hypothetical protein